TFTANVTTSVTGKGLPTGSIQFLDGTTSLGTVTLDGAGFARFSISSLALGPHSINALYNGDTTFAPSDAPSLTQTIVTADSFTLVLASSVNATVFGQATTLTATVNSLSPGSGQPTGAVTFMDNGTPLITTPLSGSVATFTTAALSVGQHALTGVYSHD